MASCKDQPYLASCGVTKNPKPDLQSNTPGSKEFTKRPKTFMPALSLRNLLTSTYYAVPTVSDTALCTLLQSSRARGVHCICLRTTCVHDPS